MGEYSFFDETIKGARAHLKFLMHDHRLPWQLAACIPPNPSGNPG